MSKSLNASAKALEAEVSEKRERQRHRTYKAGRIAFDHSGSVDCVVRNVSDTGARLDVESPVGIPDNFTLVIDKEDFKKPCHVAWRAAKSLGVHFS